MKDTRTRLAKLRGINCEGVAAVESETPATEAIYPVGTSIQFSDKTRLQAQFWRLIKWPTTNFEAKSSWRLQWTVRPAICISGSTAS